MSRINDVMDIDDAVEESSQSESSGGDRMSKLMDMDYETKETSSEPEDKKILSEHPVSGGEKSVEKSEEPKEKKEAKEEKEEKKEEEKEDKKEEEKDETPQKQKFKYKVDGEEIEEELSEEEIKSAVSGRKAIQKRFLEIDKEKKTLAKEKESFTKDYEYVQKEMGDVRNSFESVIEDFKKTGSVNKNPVDGVYNLLDKMGLDTREYDKALFYHFIPQVANFLEMDDTGREAFFLRKDNEWLVKGRDKLAEKEKEANEYRSNLEKENSAKRQAGLSEEAFSELREELETKYNLQNLNTEQVIQWSHEKPSYLRAEAIAQKVPGTDIVKIAKILLEFPGTTDEWMLEQLGYKKILEDKAMSELKSKIPAKPLAKRSTTEDTEEDDNYFKQFRRR